MGTADHWIAHLPPPPAPGTPPEDYLVSAGAMESWVTWTNLWLEIVGASSELPQAQRRGLVADGPISYGGGGQVYVLPIDLRKNEVIWEQFQGHRRALEKLADLERPEDTVSFALFTVMMSLAEGVPAHRSDDFTGFTALLRGLYAYFDVRNLWHHATSRYTFTGFSEPLTGEDGTVALMANMELLRQWVLMRWAIWCSEIGIGYLVDKAGQPVQDLGGPIPYPEDVLHQITAYYRLDLSKFQPELHALQRP